jgi:hypothetical protein
MQDAPACQLNKKQRLRPITPRNFAIAFSLYVAYI